MGLWANIIGRGIAMSYKKPTRARRSLPATTVKLRTNIMSIFGSIMGAIFGHSSAQASASPTAPPPSAPPAQSVDVAAIVDKAAAAKGEKLEWRTSIVDL